MILFHQLLLLLFVSVIVYTIDVKQKFFPVPVVLVLLGMGLSFLPIFSDFSVSRDILYEIFIPGLLFVSAYQFSARAMKKNASLILTLSTIGMFATVFLLGIGIFWITSFFEPFTWSVSFLLAAILVPTDPVSVVSILKNSTDNDEIANIVEGESLVNDGSSIVIFTILLSMVQSGDLFSPLQFLDSFAFVSIGGIAVGLVFGWIISQAIHITSHHEYQVMLSILIAYGGFAIAEFFNTSGVLATVVSGILLSFAFSKKEEKEEGFRKALGGFWNVINPTLLSILFLFIGIQAVPYIQFQNWTLWLPALIIFILSVLARFLVLGGILLAVPKWRKKFSHFFSILFLLSWSGIKGSMSVVLLLWTESTSVGQNTFLISVAFATILLSLIFQSIGIYPLSRMLKKIDNA
ncbi:cation:proton antiporter [Carnobacterium funditum]|uniref:cation:proton antiporter n=1 Tax=Carnobacterium funditum TaxID=2752 RepID=UPI00054E89CC|nr:sodium:proton antiporter [Carnobacterium funditum]